MGTLARNGLTKTKKFFSPKKFSILRKRARLTHQTRNCMFYQCFKLQCFHSMLYTALGDKIVIHQKTTPLKQLRG